MTTVFFLVPKKNKANVYIKSPSSVQLHLVLGPIASKSHLNDQQYKSIWDFMPVLAVWFPLLLYIHIQLV